MRLTALLGYRTVAELEETMSAAEYHRWIEFHHLYDLPDSYMVCGVLGALISHALGGKGHKADFAPFYTSDQKARIASNNLHALAMLRQHANRPNAKPAKPGNPPKPDQGIPRQNGSARRP